MQDTAESWTLGASTTPWLVLIHQIAPEPAYLRVKAGRRLRQLGAVAIKNTVYLLPGSAETREDFEWVAREIREDGGSALVCATEFVSGFSQAEAKALFQRDRNEEYRVVVEESQALQRKLEDSATAQRQYRRLLRMFETIVGIDFFAAAGREQAEAAVRELATRFGPKSAPMERYVADLTGKTWVTRAGVHVDRMASAWLIRRFVDPAAAFRFVRETDHVPASQEVRFDMFEGEFTHVGDRCTFEVIRERLFSSDAALAEIAEMVHDIDLKDEKFDRPEAAGLARLVRGIQQAHANDEERIERAAALLDDLYASFSATESVTVSRAESPSKQRRRR